MKCTILVVTVLSSIVESGNGFQFMSKFKAPLTPEQLAQEQATKDKFGDKKLVVLTGTSSGLGRKTAAALLRTGEYHVVGAVRDIYKMEAVAEIDGYPMDCFTPMECELNSFDSVRKFCDNLMEFKGSKSIDRLICNAGVYQPSLPYAKWSADGHEQTMQINYLSHFLMISLLIEDISKSPDPRIITVGSVTGNDNTVGGGGVYPIADLKKLDGFRAGFNNPVAMADGFGFIGAKSYKDSKLCLMMLANILHARYHKLTGVAFSSIYPGCIAESPLFREKRAWFRQIFPVFMKYITGGYVGEEEAGQRLFQVAHDPRCGKKSGVYWSWNGGPREGRGAEALEKDGQISGSGGAGGGWNSIFVNEQSGKALDLDLTMELFKLSTEITEAEWPAFKPVNSPCPTLKVIGAISKGMIEKEESKRMQERPGFNADGTPIEPKFTKVQKTKMVASKVTKGVLRRTVGRVGKFLGRRVLGKIPEEALQGSYQDEKPEEQPPISTANLQVSQPESQQGAKIVTIIDSDEKIQDDIVTLEKNSKLIESVIEREVLKNGSSKEELEQEQEKMVA